MLIVMYRVYFARLSVSFFKKLVNLYENLFFWFLFSDHLALATCCWLNGRSETTEILLYAIGCLFVCFFEIEFFVFPKISRFFVRQQFLLFSDQLASNHMLLA